MANLLLMTIISFIVSIQNNYYQSILTYVGYSTNTLVTLISLAWINFLVTLLFSKVMHKIKHIKIVIIGFTLSFIFSILALRINTIFAFLTDISGSVLAVIATQIAVTKYTKEMKSKLWLPNLLLISLGALISLLLFFKQLFLISLVLSFCVILSCYSMYKQSSVISHKENQSNHYRLKLTPTVKLYYVNTLTTVFISGLNAYYIPFIKLSHIDLSIVAFSGTVFTLIVTYTLFKRPTFSDRLAKIFLNCGRLSYVGSGLVIVLGNNKLGVVSVVLMVGGYALLSLVKKRLQLDTFTQSEIKHMFSTYTQVEYLLASVSTFCLLTLIKDKQLLFAISVIAAPIMVITTNKLIDTVYNKNHTSLVITKEASSS